MSHLEPRGTHCRAQGSAGRGRVGPRAPLASPARAPAQGAADTSQQWRAGVRPPRLSLLWHRRRERVQKRVPHRCAGSSLFTRFSDSLTFPFAVFSETASISPSFIAVLRDGLGRLTYNQTYINAACDVHFTLRGDLDQRFHRKIPLITE